MKKTLFISISCVILSCSINKKFKESPEVLSKIIKESDLSEVEVTIVNNFLDIELKKDKYKNYKGYPICIVKEAIGKSTPIIIYEYCYNSRDLPIKISTNKDWILNEKQIKQIKDTLINSRIHHWETLDFKGLNASIIEYEDLKKSIKENNYLKYSKTLILNLSIPLIINKNSAFISFTSNEGSFGYSTIDRFMVLLKKNKEDKWEIDSYYYNPNSAW